MPRLIPLVTLFWFLLVQPAFTRLEAADSNGEGSLPRPALELSKDFFKNSSMPFLEHISSEPMQNYLAMNINFPPVQALREQLQKQLSYSLKNRGEAHITVINPVEYKSSLMSKISMASIHRLAEAQAIQSSTFQALCLGRGSKELDGVLEHTWFIVVRSPQLGDLRKDIQQAYEAAGGEAGRFGQQLFYPHITVGFTKRDLHIEDGVVKDENSCVYDLLVTD